MTTILGFVAPKQEIAEKININSKNIPFRVQSGISFVKIDPKTGLSSNNEEYIIDSTAPHGIAINDDGTEIYTASNTADWIYKINTQNDEILGVPMDQNVSNPPDVITQRLKPIQCFSVQNKLYIRCSAGNWLNTSSGETTLIEGKLQMWNSDTMELIDSINLGEHTSPWHIIKSPIDDILYVALGGSEDYETAGVASVSYYNDNLSINWVTNNSSFDILHGIDVSSDGQRIYASGRGAVSYTHLRAHET